MGLPDAHRRLLGGFLVRSAAASNEFRWVAPENLHLTLRFLGNVEDGVLGQVRVRLRAVRGSPYKLALGALGSFGGTSWARVIWLGISAGAPESTDLARRIEAACRDAGMEAEDRPFRAHITLARARGRRGAELPALPEPPALEPFEVRGFTLYESRLGTGPPVYTPIESFELRE